MRPSLSRFLFCAVLCGGLLVPSLARADAFSPIPAGDAIYRQLDALSPLVEERPSKTPANLTRYEAALEVARASATIEAKPDALGRSGWRALRDLARALRPELRQLGVDVEGLLSQCERGLNAPPPAVLAAPAPTRTKGRSNGTARANTAPAMGSFLNSPSSPANRGLMQSQLDSPIVGHVRASATLLALEDARRRGMSNPLFDGRSAFDMRSRSAQSVGKDAALSIDLGSGMRISALTSRRRLGLDGLASPALSSPLFSGAREAKGFGGAFEVSPVGGLRFSTDVERLSTDAGQRALRVGGGVGLSAWQNRLTMSMHLSRLQPEDRALLPSTATEFGVGLGVTQRLSLNLLYQGLFSSQSETSRLAGGLNFSF